MEWEMGILSQREWLGESIEECIVTFVMFVAILPSHFSRPTRKEPGII